MHPMGVEFAQASNPEEIFFDHLKKVIHQSTLSDWQRPDTKELKSFRPLLLGYSGAGNIGADIRVKEIVRQFRKIFSHIDFKPGLVTIGPLLNEPFFSDVRKVPMQSYFPQFLAQAGELHDSVVACEGSMFTSTFSDMLSGIFAGGIAYATQRGRLGVGYGAEVGAMSPRLTTFVQEACKDGTIYCRNEDSRSKLNGLGIRALGGADSAWTFEAENTDAHALLQRAGWDGKAPVLAMCPVNPYWWPVVADFDKLRALQTTGRFKELHYQGAFFHTWSPGQAQKYVAYLDALAHAMNMLRSKGYFAVIVGMERLDGMSCARLNERLDQKAPVFVSGQFGMDAIGAVLRASSLVITSRFHAAVVALGGLVPTIGVSMDGRIPNLMAENGLQKWFVNCNDVLLKAKLATLAEELPQTDTTSVYKNLVQSQIKLFAEMGRSFSELVFARRPELSPKTGNAGLEFFLPPLSPRIEKLLAS